MPFRSNRPARLGKLRSDDIHSDSSTSPTPPKSDEHNDTNPLSPFRDSVQALTHRQIVRKQLLQREVSSDSTQSGDMRNLLTRTRSTPAFEFHAEPKASPTTVGSIVNNIESRIDIGQAINLLQELQKSASPEQLVALHRALLPTKETSPTPSPVLPSIEEHAYTSVPPARKRSVIPPGLATRNGISEDVLRRQHEPFKLERKPLQNEKGDWSPDSPSTDSSPSRPFTPSSQQIHAGAFQHGSLRITNGAASPTPSIISKLAIEADDAQTRSIFDVDLEDRKVSVESVTPSPPPHKLLSRPMSVVDLPAKSQAQAQSRLGMPLQRHSLQPPKSRYSTSEEQPRFQQRIGHRATHLSREYLADCEITASPYEEKCLLMEFAKRLSRVDDEEQDEDSNDRGVDQRLDTLSRLTGEPESSKDPSGERNALPSSSEEPVTSIETPSEQVVRKKDSGYCSDLSSSPLQHKPRPGTAELEGPPVPPHHAPSIDEPRDQTPINDNGTSSSPYTFEEFVGCSPRSEFMPEDTPSPSIVPKKSPLSLFKSKSKKSMINLADAQSGNGSSEALSRRSTSQTLPGEGEKQKRKLQKPMPESVRRQRKKTMENLKSAQTSRIDLVTDRESHETQDRPLTSPAATVIHLVPQSDEALTERPTSIIPDCDVEKPQERPARKRGKSFGRLRGKSVAEELLPQTHQSSRTRSKSVADANAPIPVRVSDDNTGMNCLRSTTAESPRPESSGSIHTDFNSVARALNPPSPGRVAPIPRPKHKRYYSRNTYDGESSLEGMRKEDKESVNAEAQNQPPPPPQRMASAPPQISVAVASSASVEDRFPGWQGKPASAVASNSLPWVSAGPSPLRSSTSRSTLPDVVPPLPELPADIDAKVTRADQMVAKKLKVGPRSSPNGSVRSSLDTMERKQIAARKERDARKADARKAALDQLSTPSEEPELRPGSGRGDEQRWSMDGSFQIPRPEDQAQPTSPTHDSQHPGWPSWEHQSTLWRQRREALALSFSQLQFTETESAKPPEIKLSRYITPPGAHDIPPTEPLENMDPAIRHAQSYSKLLVETPSDRPDMQRADSVFSTATIVTMASDNRSPKVDVSRTGSAISTYSTTTTTTTATSWSDVRPYRPNDALHAERSRALSRAQHQSTGSNKENLLAAPPQRPEHVRNRSSDSLFDRYSGGLNYGWNKEEGAFGGSAGTVVEAARRKGERESGGVRREEQLGLDLSDIPVFLQRNSFDRLG